MFLLRNSLPLKHHFTLVFAALFAFALALAQPHRVHHFFEQTKQRQSRGEAGSHHHDHSKTPIKSPQTECLVQALSQHCSAIPATADKLPIIATAAQLYRFALSSWVYSTSSTSFLQRAPPFLSYL